MKERLFDFTSGVLGAATGIHLIPDHPVFLGLKFIVGGLVAIGFSLLGQIVLNYYKNKKQKDGTV